MARQDSSYGFQNYTAATITGTSETALLAPTGTGIYPGLPSPQFPASTSTYPTGLFAGVPSDIVGDVFDGHPFEVAISGVVTTSATANFTLNLYNAKASSFAGGPAASSYTLATLGTGCTKVVAGSATAVGTGAASKNFWLKAQFVWDSTSGTLATCSSALYQAGASVSTTNANATSLAVTDLNFIPSFTFSAANQGVVLLREIYINRL